MANAMCSVCNKKAHYQTREGTRFLVCADGHETPDTKIIVVGTQGDTSSHTSTTLYGEAPGQADHRKD